MSTTFYLVRHAAHDNVGGFLAGRMPGIHLGVDGLAQAARLGQRMAGEPFDAIFASPRERTQETAQAIVAARAPMPIETASELDEIDFGHWAGNGWEVLNADPQWRQWNAMRSMARTPGGESMLDVQVRVVRLMEQLRTRFPEGRVVLVSHADIIKTAVSHVLGLPVDAWPRLEVSPASISTLVAGEWGGKLITLNEVTP